MKTLFSIVLALLLSNPVCAQSKQEQLLLDLSAKKFQWFIHEQYDSLQNILHDDVQYIHSNGWIENKTMAIENLKTDKLVYKSVSIIAADVRVAGTTAVVIGKGNFSGVLNGNDFTVMLLYTEVYVYTNQWQLLSRHASRLP